MFNWQIRKQLFHFRDSGRLAVLTCLILHKNNRNRSWPSNKTIMKETGYASATVTAALQWLAETFAIMPVPYDKRIGEEKKLHQRRIIWQVTGVVRLEDAFHKYLHMTPEGWLGILSDVKELGNSSLTEYLVGECSETEYSVGSAQEGIPHSEGIPSRKDNTPKEPRKRVTSPQSKKSKAYSKWERSDVIRYYEMNNADELDTFLEAWGFKTRFVDLSIPEAVSFAKAYEGLRDVNFPAENYASLVAHTRALAGWKKDLQPTEVLNHITSYREGRLAEADPYAHLPDIDYDAELRKLGITEIIR